MSASIDFTTPQRLNPLGILIGFGKKIISSVRLALGLVFVLYNKPNIYSSPYFVWFIAGLFLLLLLMTVFEIYNYSFYVDEEKEEFILKQGILNKSQKVVKFSNILQVNITQNTIQRLLNLYSVTLDSAGSAKVEVDLYALSEHQAKSLKSYLLEKIKSQKRDPSTPPLLESEKAKQFLHLETANILLFSVLANYRQGLALFFAFCMTMYNNIKDTIEGFKLEKEYDTYSNQFLGLGSMFSLVTAAVVFIILIPFAINFFRYFLKYYNFTIYKNENNTFQMEYGLTKKVNSIFNRDRVQVVLFKQNQLLKKLNLGVLSLRQIVLDRTKAEDSSLDLPGISASKKALVYDLTFEENVFEGSELIQPKIGLLISRLIKSVLLFAILLVLTVVIPFEFSKLYIYIGLLLVFLGVVVYNYLFYKTYKVYWNGRYIIKKYGVWNEKELIIAISKCQSLGISQNFFQRRKQTANLQIATSAGVYSFSFLSYELVNHIVNQSLYSLEK